jgi:acetyl esterase/lipase
VTVTVGYRTKVPFPGAIEDVADAISWVKEHIGEEQYGAGDVDRVFLSGHSAGGHLAALAAVDRRWLSRRNVPADFIKGVVSISGIYNVADPLDSPLFSWGYNKIYITPTFGNDLDFMNDSSPLIHLNSIDTAQKHHIPPFFILNASSDLGLQKDGRAFHSAFVAKGLPVQYSILERETHGTISRSTKTMTAARDFLVGVLSNLVENAATANSML